MCCHRFSSSLIAALLVAASLIPCSHVRAEFKSDNPVVDGMINRGIKYLENNYRKKTHYAFTDIASAGFGEHAFMAYAHMKVEHNASHPLVVQGVEASKRIVGLLNGKDPGTMNSKSIYNASVAALLLAEVDPERYRPELLRLAAFLSARQQRAGSFGYFGDERGDTSQTQYAILALWTIDRAGLNIEYRRIPRIIDWLLRVQASNGGWPYLASNNGTKPARASDEYRVTASMALAGGSTMLIAGDILKLWGLSAQDSGIPGLPKAIKLTDGDGENMDTPRPSYDVKRLFEAIANSDRYLSANDPNPAKLESQFPYYQLYTLERYESFKEIMTEQEPDPNPAWFRGGVAYLKSQEAPGGGWTDGTYALMRGTTSTSFAILFLIRSTQKAIGQVSSGTMAGGYSLPADTTQIRVKGTQIMGRPVATQVNDLLGMLEEDGADDLSEKSLPEDLKLAEGADERAAQLDRLERLVRGSKSWQARRVAARLLGMSDELRVVPALIFALSDKDTMVRLYARDGLRFLSRKFEGFGMPNEPSLTELRRAQDSWRAWYKKANPKYVFLSSDL